MCKFLCSTFFWIVNGVLSVCGLQSWKSRAGFCGFGSKSWGGVRGMATTVDSIQHDPECLSYLKQQEAAEIDELLMGPLGFSVDQLMVCKRWALWFVLS